jgi:beta-lactam-binding protein with PASTA domain
VSEGETQIAVPDVEGLSAAEARNRLREAGLDARTHPVASDESPGTVVEQAPGAGEEVSEGAVVALGIAEARETPPATSEPATVQVPDVVGLRSSEARSRLRDAGLRVTQRPVESQRPAGEVVSQSPRANTELREGQSVTLRVSTGPPGIEVPDVVGLDESSASRDLEAAGFAVRVVDQPTTDPAQDGVVVAQRPSAGSTSREGSEVTITVARLSETTTESVNPEE